ncbi:hypothetical protein C0995_009780 [Termitomyces sp. Mi166|nr:hypothetical protein C0995_009780 [Termitomyces sp. Mi166\
MARQKVRDRIASLPSSSFERTMLEEDERFYATFPQARQAAISAWIAQQFPYAPWAQLSSFTNEGPSIDTSLPEPYATTSVRAPTPTPDFSTFTLVNALTPRLEAPIHPPLTIVYDASTKVIERDLNSSSTDYISIDRAGSSQGCDFNQQGSTSNIVSKSYSMPTPLDQEPVFLALQVLAPARRTRLARNTRKAHLHPPPYTAAASSKQENVYPSTFFAAPESTHASAASVSPTHASAASASPPFEQPQYSGDWEADAFAAAKYLDTPLPKKSDAGASLTCAVSLRKDRHGPSSRLRQRPNMLHKPNPSSRKRAKLLRDKNGKPVMACLFCRTRKIACGPPPQGSDDPTCNQCARRGLPCHYPAESRRGQRKKRTDFINAQSNDISTLMDLYHNATLKNDLDIHVSDNLEAKWDGCDL